MTWLLILIFGLHLLQQPAISLGTNLTQSLNHNNLSVQALNSFPKFLTESLQASQNDKRVENKLSKDLLLPLWPTFSVNDGSGEGSGLQQSLEVVMPSTGPLEMDVFIPDRAEKQDFEMQELSAHPAPPMPLKLTQQIDDDDHDIILANNHSGPAQVASTMDVQLTMHTHVNNNERMNNDQALLTTNTPITEDNRTENAPVKEPFNIDAEVNNKEETTASQDMKYIGILNTVKTSESSENNGALVTQSGSSGDLRVGEERHVTSHPPAATQLQTGKESTSDLPLGSSSTTTTGATDKPRDYSKNFEDKKPKWFRGFFGPLTESDLSSVIGTCILGPCVVSTGGNVTRLQWEDLKRTLTFAWELHVFGSAALFLLLVVAATFGVIAGAKMRRPFCEAFTIANILLLVAGLLRFIQLIIDPYGSRNILPRPALLALHNVPVPLLLWAQVTLAFLTLRENMSPQRFSMTGGLAALHFTFLLMAELLSKTFSPALPLMLHTLTICWGLLLCLGIFIQSLRYLCFSLKTPIPRWSTPKHLENNARRVLLLCAFLGMFACFLQTYSLLWLYGLLGDWRRFGWGWWLVQLSARLLELAWSFSLLLLGSRAFWRSKQTARRVTKRKPSSCLDDLLDRLPMGPWRRPDKDWAELLPNNWKCHKQPSANVSQTMVRNIATPATSIMTVHDNAGVIGGGVICSSSYDHHASPLWTSGVEWQEQECFLSLIEFDLRPPSPVELHHSIDRALHHAHLLGVGTIFTPSPPSQAQNEGSGELLCDHVSPAQPNNKVYRWALDGGLSPHSPEHLTTAGQQTEVSVIEPLEASLSPNTSRKVWERDISIPRVTVDNECVSIASEDDVTSL